MKMQDQAPVLPELLKPEDKNVQAGIDQKGVEELASVGKQLMLLNKSLIELQALSARMALILEKIATHIQSVKVVR